ncbi:hypothetical protein P389DRAFT_192153 [Cystobasidium minutum MCA 4210]|uniref:uncharacterized protein n=1 Tax=Cystobasidium minutum MCA 4210 TaxID=1397322 RepID=UPI0034CF974B|eukprot:jgi/Rhomi1/192153/gm1.367_g
MATRHTLAAHAALIPLLHAARYPHETVIGCLLGPSVPTNAGSEREVRYEHAIPLLHHWTGLSAALDMAMLLVEEHAALNQWTILGFYFAHEGLGEVPTDPAKANVPILVKRLAAQAGPEVTFFALDNRKLTSPMKAFVPLSPSNSSKASISYIDSRATPAALPALIEAGQHMKLDDWDAHLEDIGARWLGNDEVDLSEFKGTVTTNDKLAIESK